MNSYKLLQNQLERISGVIALVTMPKGAEVSGFDLSLSPLTNRVKSIINEQIESVSSAISDEATLTEHGREWLLSRLSAAEHYCNMLSALTNNGAIMSMFSDISSMIDKAAMMACEIDLEGGNNG